MIAYDAAPAADDNADDTNVMTYDEYVDDDNDDDEISHAKVRMMLI